MVKNQYRPNKVIPMYLQQLANQLASELANLSSMKTDVVVLALERLTSYTYVAPKIFRIRFFFM